MWVFFVVAMVCFFLGGFYLFMYLNKNLLFRQVLYFHCPTLVTAENAALFPGCLGGPRAVLNAHQEEAELFQGWIWSGGKGIC